MSITNKQKGTIIENLVVELITFGSNGALTCYTPNADDDGLDLIINRKGDVNPLFIQVGTLHEFYNKSVPILEHF